MLKTSGLSWITATYAKSPVPVLIPRATARLAAFWARFGSLASSASISGTSFTGCPPIIAGRDASRLVSIGTSGEAAGDGASDAPAESVGLGAALIAAVGSGRQLGDGVALDATAGQDQRHGYRADPEEFPGPGAPHSSSRRRTGKRSSSTATWKPQSTQNFGVAALVASGRAPAWG